MGVMRDLQREVQRGGVVPRSPLPGAPVEAEPIEGGVPAAAPTAAQQPAPERPQAEQAPAPMADALTPAEIAALRKKYEGSGHTQTMTYDDWYDANFADSNTADIRKAAMSTPRIQAGRDPRLEPGENTQLAQSRIAAGKPLPEGREAKQYSPEQRRLMSRNVHNPEVPMTRFGGTFVQDAEGTMSSRAPNPEMLQTAEAIAADPEQGAGSASHTMALAQAFGIDAAQYGDDMDMLKADVAREKKRHDALMQKYDIKPNDMGGFRYTPNSGLREKMAAYERFQQADRLGKRFAGMMTPQEEARLDESATSLNQQMMLRRNRAQAQAVRNNTEIRNLTIAANNPRAAQGLYMRSLQVAAKSGDPLQIAAVHESFGNERAAADYRSLAGVQAQAAADAVAADAALKAKTDPPEDKRAMAEKFEAEMQAALSITNPVRQELAIKTVLSKMQYPPDQIEAATKRIIQSAAGGTAPAPSGGGGGIMDGLRWLWSQLQSAPPQAWGDASSMPVVQGGTYADQVDAIRNNPFVVPGAPQTTPLPRR